MKRKSGSAAVLIILMVAGTFILIARESIRGKSSFLSLTKGGFVKSGLPAPASGNKIETAPPPDNANTPGQGNASGPVQPAKPAPIPPRGFTVDQLSPFYKQAQLTSVSPPPRTGERGSFSIYAQSQNAMPIQITNWRLKTNTGEIKIPQAIGDYTPYLTNAGDILLGAGQYANFYSWKSASGRSFRLNTCMGYLNDFYPFDPRLSQGCPTSEFDRHDIISFSGKCQSYILSISGCKIPTSEELSWFKDEPECATFIKNTFDGYSACYNRKYRNKDFFSNIWYIWLDRTLPFDSLHDHILLLDKNDLLVDEYIY